MNILHVDIETFSPTSIKRGTYIYSEAAELLLFGYAWNDNPTQVVDCTVEGGLTEARNILLDAALEDVICFAHNAEFERVLLTKFFGNLAAELNWRCTKVQAYAHGLPGELEQLCDIYKMPADKAKDKEGKKYIQMFCVPQKDGKRKTRLTHPKEWSNFIEYCRLDVEAERELGKKLPKWNNSESELKLYKLDQKINTRGFAVDIELANAAIAAVEAEKKDKDVRTKELTDGAVNAATQRDALLKHLLEIHGVNLPDLTISTLNRRLEDPDLPEPVKELIALRLQSSGTSTRKYTTLINSASSDGRLRGTLQFCGASRTGRWSGRIFQPQNLPRPKFKAAEIETGIRALKSDCAELIYSDVKEIAASAIRGVIVAPKGKKLVVSDLSSIEGRGLAYLAGEQWKIDAYADYDLGIGYDMYVLTYARTFNVKPETVTKEQRQLGKVLELALGYGGGVGAFVTFANGYGIDLNKLAETIWPVLPDYVLSEAYSFWEWSKEHGKTYGLTEKVFVACDSIKRLWREANAMIECFWKQLENDVYSALHVGYATERNFYRVDKKGSWLRIQLPSGRYLCYAGAKLDDGKIKYLGVNQYSRKWGYLSTYGGKLAENITQAFSRDVLAYGMVCAENNGYEVVLNVHDELITEAPDKPEFNAKELSKIMSANPPWAKGLPLAAAGFEAYRYRKD